MGNRLSFYFSQGVKNLKGSVLIILGFSLALSMVSGISLYIDAYQDNQMNESFDYIIDFEASSSYYTADFSDFFQDSEDTILSLVQDSEILEIESFSRYVLFESRDLNFYKNYSTIPQEDREGREEFETYDLFAGLFDEDFYVSKRFDQYYHIIEGRYPSSENEILIPIDFAHQLNLTLGEVADLDVFHDYINYETNISSNFLLPSMEVVGIYSSKLEFYRFGQNYFRPRYVFDEETNTVKDLEHFWEPEMIFCYYNFSKLENNHPIQSLYSEIDQFFQNNIGEEDDSFYYVIRAGIAFFYKRDLIDFNHINSYSRKISRETEIIQRQLYNENGYYFTNYLSHHLINLYGESSILRIALQLLNIPILIFAIFIGSFAIKTNAKSRLDEFLLLRSKGSPNSLLRNQFFIEAFFNGIASSTIALFAGFGTFYGFRSILNEIFFSYDSTTVLSPAISWGTVILTYSFGIGITLLASFSSIAYVRKLPTYKLLGVLGSNSMDVEYDEKSLFRLKEDKKVSIEETPFYEESQDNQISTEIVKESSSKKSKKKRKKHELYQNALHVKEKKNPKLSIAFIIISLFPLIIYLLYYLGTLPSAADVFISISGLIERNLIAILIFAIISPILFVVGIIRILVIEKPSRFARISKFLSSLFLKERSYLCGMEMAKRKQYKTVILLVGIFTSLLVFTNVFLNSFSRYDIIMDNIQVGADVQAMYYNEDMVISNTSDMDLLESQLKSYKTPDNETLINQVLTYYYEWPYSEYVSDEYCGERYFIDIEKYLDIIQEDNKKLPIGDFVSNIEELIDYNKNSSNTIPGVIVNSGFLTLNKLEIGDNYPIFHKFYNSTSMEFQNESIIVKIIVSSDIMPGFYSLSSQWGDYTEKLVIDINSLKQDKDLLHGIRFYQMIDIDTDVEDDSVVLRSMLNNASSNFFEYSLFAFYNQNLDDLNYELSISETGFYGIVYLEFLMIGVLLAFGLAILILSFQRENKYFNGVLLARGFGRLGLLKLILSQISIIFIIGILTGLLSGFITSIPVLKFGIIIMYGTRLISFPLFVNILELAQILGIIVLSSFVIYLIAYYFESKKNITEYFHKF